MTRAIPHVNICGYPGSGKSTLIINLVHHYRTLLIPQVTTRVARAGDLEYIHVENDDFERMYKKGMLLQWKNAIRRKIDPQGSPYRRGAPALAWWPQPIQGTQLVLSSFSTRAAPMIQRRLAPNMINVCLVANEEVLIQRIIARFSRDSVLGHRDTIREYRKVRIEDNFQYVIHTDSIPELEVMRRVEIIAGLIQMPAPK